MSKGVEYEDLDELAQLVVMANGATASVDGKDILWCSQGQALRLPPGKERVAGSLMLVSSIYARLGARLPSALFSLCPSSV